MVPNPPLFRSSLRPALTAWIAALIVGGFTTFTPLIFNDGDTWMHIAAGERMLDLGAVLRTDPFSYTFAGRPWQTHEWLSEVIMALAYRAGGWAGVSVLFGTAAGAVAWLLTRHVQRWLGGLPLVVLVVLGLACLAPGLLARPHLLAAPLLELWTAELVFARSEGRAPDWRRMAPIMVAWANLHGSFLFGIGLFVVFGIEAGWRNRKSRLDALFPWLAASIAVVTASVMSPHGLDNLLFPLRLTRMTTLTNIDEWTPIDLQKNPKFAISLFLSAFILIWKPVKIQAIPLSILIFVVHMTFEHSRHLQLLGIVAPLLTAEPLALAFSRPPPQPRHYAAWPITASAAVATILVATRLATPFHPADSVMAPGAALAQVPPNLRSRPNFNAYPYGGFMIFNGVRPYIDSRAELYGDEFRTKFAQIDAGDACTFNEEARARHIAWTILLPGSPLAALLEASPRWRRVYADGYAVVHVHSGDTWPIPDPACVKGRR